MQKSQNQSETITSTLSGSQQQQVTSFSSNKNKI